MIQTHRAEGEVAFTPLYFGLSVKKNKKILTNDSVRIYAVIFFHFYPFFGIYSQEALDSFPFCLLNPRATFYVWRCAGGVSHHTTEE